MTFIQTKARLLKHDLPFHGTLGELETTSAVLKGKNLTPVLVMIISGNSLAFPGKFLPVLGFNGAAPQRVNSGSGKPKSRKKVPTKACGAFRPRNHKDPKVRRPQDRRYLGGSASLFGITWKVSVAIFCGQSFWSSVE